jgi:hypothetical protein
MGTRRGKDVTEQTDSTRDHAGPNESPEPGGVFGCRQGHRYRFRVKGRHGFHDGSREQSANNANTLKHTGNNCIVDGCRQQESQQRHAHRRATPAPKPQPWLQPLARKGITSLPAVVNYFTVYRQTEVN